jgi:hypothetical protein
MKINDMRSRIPSSVFFGENTHMQDKTLAQIPVNTELVRIIDSGVGITTYDVVLSQRPWIFSFNTSFLVTRFTDKLGIRPDRYGEKLRFVEINRIISNDQIFVGFVVEDRMVTPFTLNSTTKEFLFPSVTKIGAPMYRVTVKKDKTVSCTCDSYTRRISNGHRSCKHTKDVTVENYIKSLTQ